MSSPISQPAIASDEISFRVSELFEAEQTPSGAPVDFTLTNELLMIAPLVRRIVRRNLYGSPHRQAAEDIEQRVLLALWQWRGRNSDLKLTTLEMEKIAARSAKRGVSAYYRQQMRKTTYPQVDFDNNSNDNCADSDHHYSDGSSTENILIDKSVSFTGDTRAEAGSLGRFLFQAIEKLTLRQRYALLLQKNDLIVHLIATGACRIDDLSAALDLSRAEFLKVLQCLPLSDEQIGELWSEGNREILTAKQVREARCKARQNIKQALE